MQVEIFCINSKGHNVDGASIHIYADDTVVYCAGPSITEALANLPAVFNIILTQPSHLKFFLNADEMKVMHFSNTKKKPENTLDILTAQGNKLDNVSRY